MAPSRSRRAAVAHRVRQLVALRHLPPRVARFHWRAQRTARQHGDWWSPASAVRARELGYLLQLARGAELVVEVGTGTAWTAIALVLDERRRRVVSIDPLVRPERELYLRLVGGDVQRRIELIEGMDAPRLAAPEMVFIDSSHERDETRETFLRWQPRIAPGGIVVFHDYNHPS